MKNIMAFSLLLMAAISCFGQAPANVGGAGTIYVTTDPTVGTNCTIFGGAEALNINTGITSKCVAGVWQSSGTLSVSFYNIAVLPPATTALVGHLYRMTAATTANICPTAGDSGGAAIAYCVSNGTVYSAFILATGATGAIAFPNTVTLSTLSGGSAIGQAACFKTGGVIGYCSTTPTSGTCTCN
jgi:hypothetical protein